MLPNVVCIIGLLITAGPPGPPGTSGTPGLSGPACWVLNANSACDTGEDRNEDGVCDANDFQGPPSAAPVGVYARNKII